MTLISIWYRKLQGDLYAIADSRLTSSQGVLTDNAPKFSTINVLCYSVGRKNRFDRLVLNSQIAVGYAGSSSVAFSTITTVQAYCASLSVKNGGSTPSIQDVSELARRILDENYRNFGALWGDFAKCDLLIFGALAADKRLRAFHISSSLNEAGVETKSSEIKLVKEKICVSFGSASNYFMKILREDMNSTGNFDPFNILKKAIESGERHDIGGSVQVAIATKGNVTLPLIITPRPDRGEHQADTSFLGRDISSFGQVGDCSIGNEAVG